MDNDVQRALRIYYLLQYELQKSDDKAKLKNLEKLILILENSFFNKIVTIHKSLDMIKNQKNLSPEDIRLDIENESIKVEKSTNNHCKLHSKPNFVAKIKKGSTDIPLLTPAKNENSSSIKEMLPSNHLKDLKNISATNTDNMNDLRKTKTNVSQIEILSPSRLESANANHLKLSQNKVYENIRNPRWNITNANDSNIRKSNLSINTEDAEHKIFIKKMPGQELGIHLKSEKCDNKINGYVIALIDRGSPAYKSKRLSIGDLVTKIDNVYIHEATEQEVKNLLNKIICYSDEISINFIPKTDCQGSLLSKTSPFRFKENQIKHTTANNVDSEIVFPKPSMIKASGGKLTCKVQNQVEKKTMAKKDNYQEINNKKHCKTRNKVSSLIDLYDGCDHERLKVNYSVN